jgi:ribosomal protein S18 acetylase RimI-like enzyme
MKIIQLFDPKEKSEVCEKILRSLPQWFGIESAIIDYIKDVQAMEIWVAIDSDVVGFISLNKHNKHTAEIHVMGLLPEYHGKKIGSELIQSAEESLNSQGFKFLTVKTLSENRPDENYDKTRKFYLNYGFIPVEEFKTLWGEHNPCLMMAKALPMSNLVSSSINIVKTFWDLFSNQKWDEASKLLHHNFVALWPQSREKIVGSKNFIDVNRYYPGNHKIDVIHTFDVGSKIVTTVWIEADTGQKTFANSIFEILEGKILKVEEYWAEPYPAPEWRKQWVELY